jgi:protocatechuate 3,4-dioxygenase beta subunit
VTGHVTCGDTQRPARFATVMLFGVPSTLTPAPKPLGEDASSAQMEAAVKAGMASLRNTNWTETTTDQDGAFSATGVAPGDYYVFASVPGYLQPINLVKAAMEAGADMSRPLPGVLIVHVAADRQAQADVSVDRGAAIAGKVLWEDGSPVAKAIVTVVAAKNEKPAPPQFSMLVMGSAMGGGGLASISDDLGEFRIAGLAPGDYYVKVSLQTHSQFSMQKGKMNFNLARMIGNKPLVVFAPAAFHQSGAKAMTLTAGQETDGEDVTINLTGTHSVSGRITSAEDHHGINSGMVELTDASDKDFLRSASVNDDGSYTVEFVPPGTYALKASGEDTAPSTKKQTGMLNFGSGDTVRSYEDAKQQVIVAGDDVTEQNVELTPDKTVKKGPDIDGIVGGIFGGTNTSSGH